MSAVWIQVMRRYGGSPDIGIVLHIEQTAFVDALLREGLVQLVDEPAPRPIGEEKEGLDG
ncbi:hypothetical protein RCO28_37945 [Streptomyces sp. LHD-70]|uniref:hypothetical protein n=1 Tax=Streptomyces sp. LHD-70 TaxID=3072140 RepID=UPI00281089BD|nr:hypothetical protein [Streptomyces sp. LHD-70]MDQ8708201.1 hypothetical protein [Streptomyces sp. LHD-70]